MKVVTYDHQDGFKVLPTALRKEIEHAVRGCAVTPARRAARKIGDAIVDALNKDGWSGEVALAGRASKITITSAKTVQRLSPPSRIICVICAGIFR